MAPELALTTMRSLPPDSIVLDPMTGSGTVLQQAKKLGLTALGFDLDPLAVLMSKVATTTIDKAHLSLASSRVLAEARSLNGEAIELPWLDGDARANAFVKFWFGEPQRNDLRRLAYVLYHAEERGIAPVTADALRIALSRIIVTKSSRASLAQDTSHSRPHRVLKQSEYDVLDGFERSARALGKRLAKVPPTGTVQVKCGDARALSDVADNSCDMVLTSPPYLNAIDYMRGHKMSLVWLGFGLPELTETRSSSIGAERRPDKPFEADALARIVGAMGDTSDLPSRYQGMIKRYAMDLHEMLLEVTRVLKPEATATFVMGNSCLKSVYIENSEGLIAAGDLAGLAKVDRWERDLPSSSRYLPTPNSGALSKRMRKEVIVILQKPAR
jgi:hypothetical protein